MSFCDVFDVTDFVGLMKTPMNPICVFTMRDLSCNHLFQKSYGGPGPPKYRLATDNKQDGKYGALNALRVLHTT